MPSPGIHTRDLSSSAVRPNIRFLAVYLPLPFLIREHVVRNLRVVYSQKYLAGMSFHPRCPLLLLVTTSTLFCPSIASRFCSSLFSSRSSSRLKEKYGVVANSPISSSKEGPSCGLSRHRISETKSQNFWRKNFHYYYWKMGVAHCSVVEYYIIGC